MHMVVCVRGGDATLCGGSGARVMRRALPLQHEAKRARPTRSSQAVCRATRAVSRADNGDSSL